MALKNITSSLLEIPADWPDRRFSSFEVVDGVRWHVQQQGQGPTVLLIHGTGGSTHSWAGCTPLLAREHHVVAIDLPGHGFTVAPPAVERSRQLFALDSMATAIGGLLRALQLRPDAAIGHSAGVPLLLRLTLDGAIAPRHILGVCPALVAPPTWYIQFIAPLLATIVESDPAAASGAWLARTTRIVRTMLQSTGSTLTPEQLGRYEWLCQQPGHVHAAMAMMARWNLPALLREAAALRTPVTLLAGRNDRWVPLIALRRAVDTLPTMQLVEVDGGHLLLEESPEGVVERLRAKS